jgi:ABC-type glutathione transport system ATPase component
MSRPVKVTADVMARVKQLRIVGHSHREVAAILSLSITTVKSVCSGSYANGFLHRAKNPHTVLNAPANTSVATDAKKRATALKTVRAKKLAPEVSHTPEAVPSTPTATEEKEDPMLLQNQALSPEARQHFKLPRNPFVDDVQSPDDVFQSPSVRYVRAALLDCAQHHGFVAVVGESGAGKSTLAEDLEERIKMDKRNVLVVRPYVLAMEANDTKGKTLKSGAIAEAIAYALDPHVSLRSSPQARFAQVHNLLKASRAGGGAICC